MALGYLAGGASCERATCWGSSTDVKLEACLEAGKFDSMEGHLRKIDRLMESHYDKIDRLSGSWHRSVEAAWDSTQRDGFNRAISSLNQAQRGWLAKGIRDWTSYASQAVNGLLIEVQRAPVGGPFDLRTFLYRRQLRGTERGTRWARWSKRNVRAWLRRLGDALLEGLAERLSGDSRPKALLALLKAPPERAAARVYLDFQITLPRLVERLSEVQAPNAPSLPPGHLTVPGGNVA